MPKLYNQKVRDTAGALRHEGVGPKEITRRLNEDEAGLGFPVPIGERTVAEYIVDYNEIHGPPPKPGDEDQSLDSIARVKRRAIAIIQREITTLEKRRPGKISVKESQALKQHFLTLDSMEKREEEAIKRRGRSPRKSSPNSNGKEGNGNGQGKGDAAAEALAELAREQEGEVGSAHG